MKNTASLSKWTSIPLLLTLALAAAAAAVTSSCGGGENGRTSQGAGGQGASTGAAGGDSGVIHDDFANPILDPGVPADAPDLFGQPDQPGDAPCLYEPEIGSLFPKNWLRPRFRFTAAPGLNLFEITLEVPNQKSPLVVYTTNPSWTMDPATWSLITTKSTGAPIHVKIRGAALTNGMLTAGPVLGSSGDIEVAPVEAPGSVVYWTSSNGTMLKGFKIGDETVQDVLTPQQGGTQCVACHSSTPDGLFVGYAARDDLTMGGNTDRTDIRSVNGSATEMPGLTADAKALLARPGQEAPIYSRAHWQPGDRVQAMMYRVNARWEIAWVDIEATSQAQGVAWGVFARNGDPNPAGLASFSHDGTRLAYYSSPDVDAAVFANFGDIYTVEYGNRAGGAATPVPGASDPSLNEFYPVFSPDDQLLAFNRVPAGQINYNSPDSEVFVIPAAGGQAVRLAANDPPACLGLTSPGVTNSWPRWAPEKKSANGKDYYFLIFSSTRNITSGGPQLYVSPVVISGGTMTTYAAIYLWNQPESENNHTPAWDTFALPIPQ
jgi:hypothetical protein